MTTGTWLATGKDRAGSLVDVLTAPVPPLVVMAQQLEEILSLADQCEAMARVLRAEVNGRRR